jgi:hypothetical protein
MVVALTPSRFKNVTLFNHEAKPLFFQTGKHTNLIDLGHV